VFSHFCPPEQRELLDGKSTFFASMAELEKMLHALFLSLLGTE
jgi:hypothetical protein